MRAGTCGGTCGCEGLFDQIRRCEQRIGGIDGLQSLHPFCPISWGEDQLGFADGHGHLRLKVASFECVRTTVRKLSYAGFVAHVPECQEYLSKWDEAYIFQEGLV